jgi:outer membrane lipoprotein carrier protein
VAGDVDAVYENRKTYKAKFHQTYRQKVQGTEKISDGTVFVQRPNMISFRYDPPNQNRIVSDGNILKVYVADDQQMYQNPVKNTEYPGALAFIMGGGIRRSFTFTFNEKAQNPQGPVLVGKPRTPTAAYEMVQFYIDKNKVASKDIGAVIGVLILDAQGNRNRFEFHDPEEPASIDASEFSFTPPPGTTVQQ